MRKSKQRVTLDQLTSYQIKIPGMIDEKWAEWSGVEKATFDRNEDGQSITTLTLTVDQAGLQGIIRRLYSLGLPLISITNMPPPQEQTN